MPSHKKGGNNDAAARKAAGRDMVHKRMQQLDEGGKQRAAVDQAPTMGTDFSPIVANHRSHVMDLDDDYSKPHIEMRSIPLSTPPPPQAQFTEEDVPWASEIAALETELESLKAAEFRGGSSGSEGNVENSGVAGDISLRYALVPDLPSQHLAALQSLDTNGNGEVSLQALLHAADEQRQLTRQVAVLLAAGVFLLVTTCVVTYLASLFAQTKNAVNGALVAKGVDAKGEILKTSVSEELFPIAYAPLLENAELDTIRLITLQKLTTYGDDDKPEVCTTCAKQIILQVRTPFEHPSPTPPRRPLLPVSTARDPCSASW